MGLVPFSLPSDEPAICRECVRCGAVLDVTPEDQLECPRCGRVRAWTVSVNGRLMGAGLERPRRGFAIWLGGELADLLPASLCESTASDRDWDEDVDTDECESTASDPDWDEDVDTGEYESTASDPDWDDDVDTDECDPDWNEGVDTDE